ncbi:MAG: ABC transporter permease [Proteobacteria bacterium]|nr:ABC transporter permease [Pseudomonadota bacterium]
MRRQLSGAVGGILSLGAGTVGLALVLFVVVLALIGPFVRPYSPTAFVGMSFAHPSARYWLGTDVLGRDTLSRVLAGGWRILVMSIAATLLGVGTGALLGITAGYSKGVIDDAIMRTSDVLMAFPQLILALLFISLIGPKLWLVTILVGAIHAPQVARVFRGATLRVAAEDFVRHAESLGVATWRIILREILPNVTTPLMVELGLRLAYSVTLITGLSFLGFGVQPPTADWGTMINENRIGLMASPWPVLVPIILIALLTIGMNLLTDALSRAMLGRGRRVELVALDDKPDPADAGMVVAGGGTR